MALLTFSGSVAKGQAKAMTLNKGAIAACATVSGDAYWSTAANIRRALVVYASEGGQEHVLPFDFSQSSPAASLTVSSKGRDTWQIKRVVLLDFDGGELVIERATLEAQLPGGVSVLDLSFAAPVGPSLSVTSGLNMWFKADSLALSDGASVTSWADEQGGVPLVGDTHFPTYVASSMNGKPAVRFPLTGYGQYSSALNMSSRGLPDDFSFFVVAKPNSSSQGYNWICAAYNPSNSTQRFVLRFDMGFTRALANATRSDWSLDTQVIGGSVGANTPCILASTMLLSSYSQYHPELPVGQQSSFKGYFNGTQTFSSTDTYGFGNGGNTQFSLGGLPSTPVTDCDGDIAELIVYNRVLTTQELADVHSYLGTKYGISV